MSVSGCVCVMGWNWHRAAAGSRVGPGAGAGRGSAGKGGGSGATEGRPAAVSESPYAGFSVGLSESLALWFIRVIRASAPRNPSQKKVRAAPCRMLSLSDTDVVENLHSLLVSLLLH